MESVEPPHERRWNLYSVKTIHKFGADSCIENLQFEARGSVGFTPEKLHSVESSHARTNFRMNFVSDFVLCMDGATKIFSFVNSGNSTAVGEFWPSIRIKWDTDTFGFVKM